MTTVSIINLCCPVYAPFASTTVAERLSSFPIKSIIGFVSLHTILIYLHKLIFSITLSITRAFTPRPSIDISPVFTPYIGKVSAANMQSADISALPIFIEVYFLRRTASMSVPPDEAPMLNKIALPTAGKKIAYTSSIIVSFVTGPLSGTIYSSPCREKDISNEQYTVFIPNSFPRKIKPIISNNILKITTILPFVKNPTVYLDKITAIPVAPPKEKLLVNLKK